MPRWPSWQGHHLGKVEAAGSNPARGFKFFLNDSCIFCLKKGVPEYFSNVQGFLGCPSNLKVPESAFKLNSISFVDKSQKPIFSSTISYRPLYCIA